MSWFGFIYGGQLRSSRDSLLRSSGPYVPPPGCDQLLNHGALIVIAIRHRRS